MGAQIGAGRKRVPDSVRELRGDKPGEYKKNNDAPKPATSVPEPPSHLNAKQKKWFTHFAEMIFDMGIMTDKDADGIATLAVNYEMWIRTNKLLNKEGPVLTRIDAQGNEIKQKNPALTANMECFKAIMQLLTNYGLTPTSRGKVSVVDHSKPTVGNPKGKAVDGWGEL